MYTYFRKPNSQELKSVREWLLWAVADAEKRLGSGTGQLKLRYVYNMFIDRFAHLSTIITFDMFSGMVDNAVERPSKNGASFNETLSKDDRIDGVSRWNNDVDVENPSILKRPIIIDDRNLQIGYDEEEIELFKKLRSISRCDKECPHYETCGDTRGEYC